MLNHGTPLIIASWRLGHARPSITLDIYGHLIPDRQAETAEMMDELVTPNELHRIAPESRPAEFNCLPIPSHLRDGNKEKVEFDFFSVFQRSFRLAGSRYFSGGRAKGQTPHSKGSQNSSAEPASYLLFNWDKGNMEFARMRANS
jgi:hypothetical protein